MWRKNASRLRRGEAGRKRERLLVKLYADSTTVAGKMQAKAVVGAFFLKGREEYDKMEPDLQGGCSMRYVLMALGAAAMVGLDQLTKYWTVQNIPLGTQVPAWPGVFHLTHFQNTGMAFSMLEGARWLFLILTAVVLAALVVAVAKKWLRHPLALAAVTFIVGGGIGNMIDRALYGYVVDMIEVEFMNFAIFNVADSFVCIGAALLVIWAIFFDKKKPEEKQ